MAKQKRDNAHYLDVLKRKHPAIYADHLAGRFRSASAAFIEAGIRKPPRAIHALMRAWKKASASERADFLSSIGATAAAARTSGPTSGTVAIADPDSRLTAPGKRRIEEIMTMRGIKMGVVMDELGGVRLDASISRAMNRNHRLKPSLVAALQAWVDRH